jgi:hypothetical protein
MYYTVSVTPVYLLYFCSEKVVFVDLMRAFFSELIWELNYVICASRKKITYQINAILHWVNK